MLNSTIRLCTCILFIVIGLNASAQHFVHGVVTDQSAKPIANASVAIITRADSITALSFAITNARGEFSIQVPAGLASGNLRTSNLGFKTFYTAYRAGDDNFKITLLPEVNMLKQINIRQKSILNKHGDTLNYDVASFAKGQDRTIGDVIKSLPGITVNSQGQISYNGRPINKFYIDEDDLLGNRYNLASETIPVDAVDKIQILENHQPVKVLKNVVNSNQAALNLKLKNTAKLKVFGAGEVDGGTPNALKVDVNDMLFKDKLKFLNTLTYDNIGNDLSYNVESHTLEDFFDDFERPANRQMLDTKTILDPQIDRQRWLFNKSGLITGNTLVKFGEENSLRINAYYKPGLYDQYYNSSTIYFLPGGDLAQHETENSETKGKTVSLSLNYQQNSKNIYLENKLDVELQDENVAASLNSEAGNAAQSLNNHKRDFQNNFKLIKPFSKFFLLNISSEIGYNSFPENLSITPGIFPVILNDSIPYNNVDQNITKNAVYSRNKASLGINGLKFKQTYEIGYDIEYAKFDSHMTVEQMNGNYDLLPDAFQNNASWQDHDLAFAAGYTYTTGPFLFTARLPLNIKRIDFRDTIHGKSDTLINARIFSPDLSIKWDIAPKHSLTVAAGRSVSFGQPEDMLPGEIIGNYRTIYDNNAVLNERETLNGNLIYSYRDPLSILFTNAGLNYSSSTNSTLTKIDLDPDGLVNINRLPYNNTSNRLMLLGNVSKYLFDLKTTVKFGVNITESSQDEIQNDILLRVENKSIDISGNINSKPASAYNFDYNIDYLIANSESNETADGNGGRVNSVVQKLTFTYFAKSNFYVQTFNELQLLNSKQTNAGIFFNDIKLSYSIKKSKTDIGLAATNTFNRKTYVYQSIDLNSSEIDRFELRPRTILLSVRFIL